MADTKNSSNMNGGILLAAATNHWLRVIIARLLWCFVSFFWVSFSGLFYRTWSPHGPTGREPEHTWLSARTHRLTWSHIRPSSSKKKTIILIWTWFFRSVCRCRWKLEFDSGGLPCKVLSDFWKNSQTWYFTCLTRNTPARHVFSPDKRPNCLGENDKPVIHIVIVFFLRINVCFFCFCDFRHFVPCF